MNIFEAFPNAIVDDVWQLGQLKRSTLTGKTLANLTTIPVIVDEAQSITNATAANAPETANADILLYVSPENLPTLDIGELQNSYGWYNLQTGKYYTITTVGIGKNQQIGEVEHVEFNLRLVDMESNNG